MKRQSFKIKYIIISITLALFAVLVACGNETNNKVPSTISHKIYPKPKNPTP
ncbi:hypothetical protein ABSA28_00239 [Candidatus Hepatincolaceae symbiont of Richtersius coronifer]